MNKWKITAYMFLAGAVLSLGGCAGSSRDSMYLQAEVRGDSVQQDADLTQDAEENADERKDAPADGPDAGRSEEKSAYKDDEKDTQDSTCFVYVCGAVNHPGVFELPQGSRVYEAVALAGGFRKDAYEKGINQALQITDGDMIEVLTKKEHKEMAQNPGAADASKEEAVRDGLADGRININTADAAQLMTLSGIGEAKAASIVEYREKNGAFSAKEELMNVSGIGEGVYAKIQDKITVTQ